MVRKIQYIILLVALLVSTNINAQTQNPDSVSVNINDTVDAIPQDSLAVLDSIFSHNTEILDSNYVPLDSVEYSFNAYMFSIIDSIKVQKWKYNTDIHNFDIFEFDSTLKEFHIDHPAYKKSINNTYLGHSGLAVKSNIYFNPNPETGFLFLNSFSPYIFQANQATYYNVNLPFTLFGYNAGPREEQSIDVIHTQNVNKYLNFFVKFKNYTGQGHYLNQETKNNSGIFGGSHVRDRFSTHFSFTFSRISVQENGGIIDPFFITDTTIGQTEVGIRLNKGTNYIKDRQFFIDQKIGFIKGRRSDTTKQGDYLTSFQYSYYRQKDRRIYEDNDEAYLNTLTNEYNNAYQNNYSGTSTFDTNAYIHNAHLVRLNLEEALQNILGFGAYVGVGKHYTNYSYYNKDSLFINKLDTTTTSSFADAGIFRLNPKSDLNFYGHYRHFLSGHRQHDFTLSGMISVGIGRGRFKTKVSAEGKTENKTPDYFLNRFRSNHFQWDNNFKKENVTELKGEISLPNLQTTFGARYAMLTNYIYFDTDALPAQFESDFNVFDVYFNNTLSGGGFNLINKVNFQQTGKPEVLPLPDWSFYHALYYERLINFRSTKGKMKLQLGTDVNYWTSFYAPGYSPATSQFHVQNEQLVGDYPFVGAFLNLQIKRMRIYFKGEHVNYSFMKDRNMANYFMAPGYPTPRMVVKYGISWSFYD